MLLPIAPAALAPARQLLCPEAMRSAQPWLLLATGEKKPSFPGCKWFKTPKWQQSETPGPLSDEGSRVFGWGWAENKPSSTTQQMNPLDLAPASIPGLLPSGHGEQEQQDFTTFHLSTPFSTNTQPLQQLLAAPPALQDPGRCDPANSSTCQFAGSGRGYSGFTGHLLAVLQRTG